MPYNNTMITVCQELSHFTPVNTHHDEIAKNAMHLINNETKFFPVNTHPLFRIRAIANNDD